MHKRLHIKSVGKSNRKCVIFMTSFVVIVSLFFYFYYFQRTRVSVKVLEFHGWLQLVLV